MKEDLDGHKYLQNPENRTKERWTNSCGFLTNNNQNLSETDFSEMLNPWLYIYQGFHFFFQILKILSPF